jgi:hypothetical protein
MIWPAGRAPTASAPSRNGSERNATPGPPPPGRGRWRLTLHHRRYAPNIDPNTVLIVELVSATARRLDTAWNTPATLTFTIDGRSPAAALIAELATDVLAWRWDDPTGQEWCMFRGVVTQTVDTLDEQSHTVTVTCHDYAALLARRITTSVMAVTGQDQDQIALSLLSLAVNVQSSSGVALQPGGWLPVAGVLVDPSGAGRGYSGTLRDRTYPPQTGIGTAFDELAKVSGGFDYQANARGDGINIFFPYQGQGRTDLVLLYGGSVSTVQRTVNSADYANYQRTLGNNGSSDPMAAQLYSEAWNADANNVTAAPQGLWMAASNNADVTIQSTLDQRAAGDLALSGVLTPTYTVGLTPGWYSRTNPNLGDTVALVVQSGRLNVTTQVRVVGITYTIGDDGQEDVTLTVGRPLTDLADLFAQTDNDVNALTRR